MVAQSNRINALSVMGLSKVKKMQVWTAHKFEIKFGTKIIVENSEKLPEELDWMVSVLKKLECFARLKLPVDAIKKAVMHAKWIEVSSKSEPVVLIETSMPNERVVQEAFSKYLIFSSSITFFAKVKQP